MEARGRSWRSWRCSPTPPAGTARCWSVNDRADLAARGRRRRAAPRPGRPAGAGGPRDPRRRRRSSAGPRTTEPQVDAAAVEPGVDYFCVGPDLADPDQAGPARARPGPDPVRGRARDRPALVRHRRHRPGQPRRGAGGGRPPGRRGPRDHRGRRPEAAARALRTRLTAAAPVPPAPGPGEPPRVRRGARGVPARHRRRWRSCCGPGSTRAGAAGCCPRPDLVVFVAWDLYAIARRPLDVRPAPDDRRSCCRAGCRWTSCCSSWSPRPARSSPSRRSARCAGWPVGDENRCRGELHRAGGRSAWPARSWSTPSLLRTWLLRRRTYWTAYAIVLFFQLITNGILTGFDIVRYDPAAILGCGSRSPRWRTCCSATRW